jgi:hypothetical protein
MVSGGTEREDGAVVKHNYYETYTPSMHFPASQITTHCSNVHGIEPAHFGLREGRNPDIVFPSPSIGRHCKAS